MSKPSSSSESDKARAGFERKLCSLIGCRINKVSYFDVYNCSDEPRVWDFGGWHQAVMGLELATDRGPVSVLWANTFDAYGVEPFESPMTEQLLFGPEGPEGWTVTDHPVWQERVDSPVQGVSVAWESRTYTPLKEVWNREAKKYEHFPEASYSREAPVALRLDWETGPLWIVAALVQDATVDRAFLGGDELIVVLSADVMDRLGLSEAQFERV